MDIWKAVPGFEGTYEACTNGDIRRVGRKILSPATRKDGYRAVTLWKNNKPRTWLVHRLILRTFIGECPQGMNSNHKDGVKGNNSVSNLEYVTYSQNIIHAFENGLISPRDFKGDKNPRAKITEAQAIAIFGELKTGKSPTEIAREMSVPRRAVYCLKYGLTWHHLDRQPA